MFLPLAGLLVGVLAGLVLNVNVGGRGTATIGGIVQGAFNRVSGAANRAPRGAAQ